MYGKIVLRCRQEQLRQVSRLGDEAFNQHIVKVAIESWFVEELLILGGGDDV